MEEIARSPDDFASAFESSFARLQIHIEEACGSGDGWVDGTASAIRAAFGFAAGDPSAANALTNEALTSGRDGLARRGRLLDYLAEGLAPGRGYRQDGQELPTLTEQGLAGGLVGLVAERVARNRADELPGLVPDAIQFTLTPYLGSDRARQVAARFAWPGSQPDR